MIDKPLLILPAYNEARNIERVLAGVRASGVQIDIVVVDDGSEDQTAERARGAGAHVIRLSMNLGYGVALQTGYKYALRKGYGYLVQMDSDGQHEPSAVPSLLQVVQSGECDIVIGSRFLHDTTYRVPYARRMGMVIFSATIRQLTGLRVSDPTSGFQAMNRDVVNLLATDLYPVDYPDADVIIMLHRMGFRIKEIPVAMYASDGSSMHRGLRPLYYVFKMCLSILMTLIRAPSRTPVS